MSAPETSQLSQQSPRDVYRERLTRTQQSLDAIQRQDRQFVRIRIGLFAAVLLTGLACLGSESIGWSWLFLPLALFVGQLPLHARVIRRQGTLERIRQFYQSCLDRLDRRWINQRQDGREFLQIDHPRALDLDVFGHGSLFQLLNECRTGPGRRELANWLTTVPDATVIRQRQGRSQAMKFNLELREKLAQICDMADWSKAEQMLQEWAQRPLRMIPFWIVACSCLLGIIAVPIVILITLGILPFSAILLLLVLQMPLMALSREQISETTSEMDSVDTALQQLSQVTRIFEQEYFTDPDLLQLQSHLAGVEGPTYQAIERLSRLTGWLNDSVRNQFFALIAWVCGLLVLLTWLLERWKQQHGNDVERWLATAARFEATVSVAAFAFEHREYCLPEISVDAPEFTAVRLGHALLPPSECVRNDVSLTADHPLILISGSNMSGKSTLLRSIGSNVVLAFCGAVTCADRLVIHPFQLATAMRVSDSLQEGRSLFMTVVQRLKTVVDLTEGHRTVLFLLDEILHGTNSHDRRHGAEAVIRTLVDRHALGLVTTHDLALTQIVDSMDGRAVNKHFEDSVVDGHMTFDYLLRDGVVQRSNAIELMRMMGLNV